MPLGSLSFDAQFRSRYASLRRQYALKFGRRGSRNFAPPPASFSESAASSENSARDYRPPGLMQLESRCETIAHSVCPLGLEGPPPLSDNLGIIANSPLDQNARG